MPLPTLADYRAAPPHPERKSGGRRAAAADHDLAAAPGGGSDSPKITVVTVVWNACEALAKTVASVQAQDYPGLEYVVVDGGSSDGTVEWLESHGDGFDLWISEPDGGIYDAMNKGIALARGDLVAMLNAGDVYVEGALAAAGEAFERHGPDAIYYGDAWIHYTDLDLVLHARAEPEALSRRASICHQAVFVPLELHASAGLYDLSYRLAADYAFLAGQRLAGRTFHDLECPIVLYRNDGLSSQRQFVRYRREQIGFHRARATGHVTAATAVAALDVALYYAHALLHPVVGTRLADALKRWWFSRRANVVSEVTVDPGLATLTGG